MPRTSTGGVVTIGNFDGVHRGHQAMLADVAARAQRHSSPAVVVTFDPHPVSVLRPDVTVPRLTTIATRTALLKQHGADEVVVLPVDTDLLSMLPLQFFDEVIQGSLNAAEIVEGPDFRFGRDRAGDIDFLRTRCRDSDIRLAVFSAVLESGAVISSTRIRSLLVSGKVTEAVDLLGHSYTISGTVSHGAGRGRKLGIPTANLEGVKELLPGNGVYAANCCINNVQHPVAINIGPNPTFVDQMQKIECHVVGFSGDLYGRRLQVELTREIREVRTFASTEELVRQVREDIKQCRAVFENRQT